MASITRRDVLDLIDEVVDRGSPVTANRLLSWIKTLFSWAVDRGVVEANPAAGIKPPHKERPRDRTLTEDELRRVWGAFDPMGYPFGDLGKLLVMTAQRRGEVAGMRWDQDRPRGCRLAPGSRPTRRPPASTWCRSRRRWSSILRRLPRFERSPLVFPASRLSSDRPVSGFSKALRRAMRPERRRRLALARPAPDGRHRHGQARRAAARLRAGLEPHAPGATLSQVARIYNMHSTAMKCAGPWRCGRPRSSASWLGSRPRWWRCADDHRRRVAAPVRAHRQGAAGNCRCAAKASSIGRASRRTGCSSACGRSMATSSR